MRIAERKTRDEREKAGIRGTGDGEKGFLRKRLEVSRGFARHVLDEAQGRQLNPFARYAAGLDAEEVKQKYADAGRYFDGLVMSGRTVDEKGRLTEDGKRRLMNAAVWLYALEVRTRELGVAPDGEDTSR